MPLPFELAVHVSSSSLVRKKEPPSSRNTYLSGSKHFDSFPSFIWGNTFIFGLFEKCAGNVFYSKPRKGTKYCSSSCFLQTRDVPDVSRMGYHFPFSNGQLPPEVRNCDCLFRPLRGPIYRYSLLWGISSTR